jgi:hypothetical protein
VVEVRTPDGDAVGGVVPHIIYARGALRTQKNAEFRKEVCADGAAELAKGTYVRALYSRKDVVLEDRTRVGRWLCSEGNISVGEHCDLGARTLAEGRLEIGRMSRFRYLYGMPVATRREGEAPVAAETPAVTGESIDTAAVYAANNNLTLPPSTRMAPGAPQPTPALRHETNPRPYFAPMINAPFFIPGTTTTHSDLSRSGCGTPLSGACMIS